MPVEEARVLILSRVRPLAAERVPLSDAAGRALAEPLVSRRTLPPWPCSSMDGYAISAATAGEVGATLRVVGRVRAGHMPDREIGPLETMRIFTGAPLPAGADTVLRAVRAGLSRS